MDQERFLKFVAGRRWRVAQSSPHEYTIKFWHSDRREFYAAVRHARQHGEPGQWGGETFVYYRPGDGWRYFDAAPNSGPGAVVAFNRARESGQLRLWEDSR